MTMQTDSNNIFQDSNFKEKIAAEIVLLQQRKTNNRASLEFALRDAIPNANFHESIKSKIFQHGIQMIQKLMRLPIIGKNLMVYQLN